MNAIVLFPQAETFSHQFRASFVQSAQLFPAKGGRLVVGRWSWQGDDDGHCDESLSQLSSENLLPPGTGVWPDEDWSRLGFLCVRPLLAFGNGRYRADRVCLTWIQPTLLDKAGHLVSRNWIYSTDEWRSSATDILSSVAARFGYSLSTKADQHAEAFGSAAAGRAIIFRNAGQFRHAGDVLQQFASFYLAVQPDIRHLQIVTAGFRDALIGPALQIIGGVQDEAPAAMPLKSFCLKDVEALCRSPRITSELRYDAWNPDAETYGVKMRHALAKVQGLPRTPNLLSDQRVLACVDALTAHGFLEPNVTLAMYDNPLDRRAISHIYKHKAMYRRQIETSILLAAGLSQNPDHEIARLASGLVPRAARSRFTGVSGFIEPSILKAALMDLCAQPERLSLSEFSQIFSSLESWARSAGPRRQMNRFLESLPRPAA